VDPVFQTKMLEMLKQTGRPEMVVGIRSWAYKVMTFVGYRVVPFTSRLWLLDVGYENTN